MQAKIVILSYPQYCRYRAILKRFEGIGDDWSQTPLLTALCGFSSLASNLRVMFCRDSFDYPELEMHEYVCNYLAPKLSGRSRGRKRQSRSISPFSGIKRKYESDSESADSDVSVYSVKKGKFEEGPSNVLRLNPRQLRNKVKSDLSINCVDRHKLKRDKSAISKYTEKSIHERRFIKNLPEKAQLWKGKNSPNFKNCELIKTSNSCTEESFFLRKLHEFHVKQNNNIPKMFWISLKGVHLYAIFRQVKKLGGYDAVTSRKQWKKLFGEDSPAHFTISRRKYERILLPLERSELVNRKSVKIEIKKECDNYEKVSHKVLSLKVKIKKENNLESACNIKPEFGREYMEEIQDKIKSNQNACNNINEKQGSEYKPSITSERRISVFSNCVNPVPLTVILGATDNLENSTSERHLMKPMTTSSSNKAAVSSISPTQKIEIQQPHTTITFHQTRIRPNKHSKISAMESQITSQIKITNQIQIQQITLQPSPVDISAKCKGAKILCNIKQGEDGQEIQIENINKSHPIVFPTKESQSQKSHIKTKINRPENKNVPFITPGTTITPLLVPNPTNRTHSEVVHLVGDDAGPSNNNDSNRNGFFSSDVQNILPPLKKKKLDILREGGLEVTAISNKYGVISPTASLAILPNEFSHDTEGQAHKIKLYPPTRTKTNFSPIDLNVSATNMYNSNGKVFGNPKDIFPAGLASTGYEEVLDLTVKPSYSIPLSSTQSKPLLSAISLSSKPKLTDNALQITLVPPHTTPEQCNSYEDNQNIKNNAQKIMPVSSPLKLERGTNETVKMDTTLTTSSQNEVFTGSSISSFSLPQYNSQISKGTRSVLNMFNPGLLANLYSQSPNYFSPNQIPQELLELIKNLPSEKSTIPLTKY